MTTDGQSDTQLYNLQF